tara:strand:+ start:2553 stop:4427 length:1875 start_codon:yes stop_codon:yes gene_type:complete
MSIVAGSVSYTHKEMVDQNSFRKSFGNFVYDYYKELNYKNVCLSYWHRNVSPESHHDKQPLSRGSHLLVSDLRLDNREELIEALPFVTTSSPDSDLLYAAYSRWGPECVNYLVGAFAFAIWNKETDTLFCARDHMGQKPLYYSEVSDRAGKAFLFCSSPVGLIEHPRVTRDANPEGIFNVLMGRECNELTETVLSNVTRLAAGYCMQVNSSGIKLTRYWAPHAGPDIRYAKDQDYVDDFKERLSSAVESCINTNWPVSSFLSGGLDSSTISCIANCLLNENDRRLTTASFVLPKNESGIDERAYIDQILMKNDFDHLYVTKDGMSFLGGVDKNFDVYQGFPYLLHAYHLNLLPKLADRGIRVHLCGYGGDQVASYHGMWVLERLFLDGRWSMLGKMIKASSYDQSSSSARIFLSMLRNIVTEVLPDMRSDQWYEDKARKKLILPSLANRPSYREKVLRSHSLHSRLFPKSIGDVMKNLIQYDKTSVRLEQISAIYLPFGIEYRTPLTDIRLIQYCMSIPPEQFVIGKKRSLMRRAAKDVIPESIRLGHNKFQGSLPNLFDLMWEDRSQLIERLYSCSKDSDIASLIDISKLDHYLKQKNVPENVKPKLFRNIQMALYLAWLKRD